MNRKWTIICATLVCGGLIALLPLGMQLWAISVLKAESSAGTLGISWNADRYSKWLAKAAIIKDSKCHPVIITLLDEPQDVRRLARAIPWAKHLYSIRVPGEQSSIELLCEAATKLPELKVLDVSGARLSDTSVSSLAKLPNLKALSICVSPQSLMHLPVLPELIQLQVACPEPLTSTHLEKLLEARELQFLLLERSTVSVRDLASVNWTHANLKSVHLAYMEASEADLQHLVAKMKSEAPRLEEVGLGARTFRPNSRTGAP